MDGFAGGAAGCGGGGGFPCLGECGFRGLRDEIDEAVRGSKARAIVLFRNIARGDKFHAAFSLTHVPEVGLATLEFRIRPRKSHAVVMHMIWREVARLGLITRNLAPGCAENDPLSHPRHSRVRRARGRRGFGGSVS